MEVVHQIHLEGEHKHYQNLFLTMSCRVQISFSMKVCKLKRNKSISYKTVLQGLRDEDKEPTSVKIEVSLDLGMNS